MTSFALQNATLIIKKATGNFPELFRPTKFGTSIKFRLSLVFSKDDEEDMAQVEYIDRKLQPLAVEVKNMFPKMKFMYPLVDGAKKDNDCNKDYYFLNLGRAKRAGPPKVLDFSGNIITDESEIWGGCKFCILCQVFGYKYETMNVGLGLNMEQVRKIENSAQAPKIPIDPSFEKEFMDIGTEYVKSHSIQTEEKVDVEVDPGAFKMDGDDSGFMPAF